MHIEFLLLLLAIGSIGGFLSGLLGVGGGLIFVPALYACLTAYGVDVGHAIRIAIGTSTALILATTASSTYWHHKKGAIDFFILRNWWMYIVAGVAAGTTFASAVDGLFLKQFFAAMTLPMAAYMVFSKEPALKPKTHPVAMPIQGMIVALIGSLSSLIGVGGAIMTIPFMTYIGIPMRKTVGTSAALGFIISLPAMIGYILSGLPHLDELPRWSLGYVNLAAIAAILPVSLLLSPVGVHVSHKISRTALRRIFAAVIVAVSIRMFMTL